MEGGWGEGTSRYSSDLVWGSGEPHGAPLVLTLTLVRVRGTQGVVDLNYGKRRGRNGKLPSPALQVRSLQKAAVTVGLALLQALLSARMDTCARGRSALLAPSSPGRRPSTSHPLQPRPTAGFSCTCCPPPLWSPRAQLSTSTPNSVQNCERPIHALPTGGLQAAAGTEASSAIRNQSQTSSCKPFCPRSPSVAPPLTPTLTPEPDTVLPPSRLPARDPLSTPQCLHFCNYRVSSVPRPHEPALATSSFPTRAMARLCLCHTLRLAPLGSPSQSCQEEVSEIQKKMRTRLSRAQKTSRQSWASVQTPDRGVWGNLGCGVAFHT